MAVKFDKEMILKHRFWVMLGVSVILILVGIFYLQFAVSADEQIADIKKDLDKVKTLKAPFHGKSGIDARAADAALAQKAEREIWEAAFKVQEELFKWSPEVEAAFDYLGGRFANEIKLNKGVDPKAWPADTEFLVHGTLVSHDENGFTLKTKKGQEKFYPTPKAGTINIVDEGNKAVDINKMKDYAANRHVAVTYQRGRYFGDGLTLSERLVFADSYKGQIHEILKIVDPYDIKGNGVVQLRDWLYTPDEFPDESKKFIRYVIPEWNRLKDFSKGAWVAQENLWIQREIYRIIKETNDSVSHFEGKGGSEKGKPYKFKNSYFEVELTLRPDSSLDFTITNLLPRRQRLDLSFIVKTNDGKGFKPEAPIKISGDPLYPAGDKKASLTRNFPAPKGDARKGVYAVTQVLTWETAAVKRIDQVTIGSAVGDELAHSQRTFVDGLRPFLDADIDAPNEGDPVQAPAGGKGGGFAPKGGPKGAARPNFGGGAGGTNVGLLDHGLWRNRYVGVDGITNQSRRIPVGIVLIIDQDHADRVLTHFNNSKLRFLETQVLLNHYPASLQPPAPPDAKADAARPGGGNVFGPGFGPGRPGAGGPAAPAAGGGSQDLETNMEIVIYGIMTLYNRFPLRPGMPSVGAPTTPAAPVPAPGNAPVVPKV